MESFRAHAPHALGASARAEGFTLIELLVVLAIIIVILAIALTSQSSFNRTLILANAAYDVGLTLRSAETYGISSRGSGALSNVGYGLHFSAAPNASFTLFADNNAPSSSSCHGTPPSGNLSAPDASRGNCAYDGSSESVSTYTLGNGIKITDFCGIRATGIKSCASTGASSLDIVFSRPNPVPFISASGAYLGSGASACLTLASPEGATKYVSVESTGEIDPRAASCP